MKLNLLFLLLFFFVGSLDALFVSRNLKKVRIITKPLVVPFLLIYYLLSVKMPSIFIIFSLISSTAGDIFLLFRNSRKFLFFGITSFLFAHIFYMFLFIESVNISSIPFWFYTLLVPYILMGRTVFKSLNLNKGLIKYGVILYIFVITIMSFTSLMRFFSASFISFILTFSGSILFILSDSLLSIRYFGKRVIRGEFVTITYIIAQFLIVSGFIY